VGALQRLSPTDIPWSSDAPYYLVCHDRDLAEDTASIGRLLDGLATGVRYMSANEYADCPHAGISLNSSSRDLAIRLEYDAHYCAYVGGSRSNWVPQLSDETRRDLGGRDGGEAGHRSAGRDGPSPDSSGPPTVNCPPRNTKRIPSGGCSGCSNVAGLPMRSASNTTRSARSPSATQP